jgi:hypothetical protein
MAHATAVPRTSVGLRGRASAKLKGLREEAECGDDLGAIAIVVAAVAVFVFSIVGILTGIALTLYFTAG